MEKCKDDLERQFYLQMTKRYGWTKRLLANFIEAQTYEKYLLNQTNFESTLPAEQHVQAKLALKDEYTFDFAELSPAYSEHELEQALVRNIRAFLIEMGGDFPSSAISIICKLVAAISISICCFSTEDCAAL